MDFSDNILDYEGDDEVQSNLGKRTLQKKDKSEDHKLDENSNLSGSDDQYLQIDISEEKDSLFIDVGPLETTNAEKEKEEEDKNRERRTEQQISLKNELSTQENKSNQRHIKNNNTFHNGRVIQRIQQMEHRKSFRRRPKSRQNSINCIPINLNGRFSQPSSNPGTYFNFRWNSSFFNFCEPSFNKNPMGLGISGKDTFYNNQLTNRSYQAKILSKDGIFHRIQNIGPVVNQNGGFQISGGSRGRTLNEGKLSSLCTKVNLNSLGIGTLENRDSDEYEKKTMQLKKEARLKRFMCDESTMKECSLSSCVKEIEKQDSPSENCVRLTCQSKEKSNSDNDQHSFLEGKPKPDINKESLLKKRNPFDDQSETSNCTQRSKVKHENDMTGRVKESKDRFYVVKNDADSPVKFVRSFPKSFSELALRTHNRPLEDEHSLFPRSVTALSSLRSNSNISPSKNAAQMVPQLTGSIVKVLNIPPETTTEDILALCQPIGMIREFKANFPKENSVVIRFTESSSAEKFYSVYHGQKLNSNFLNVIVV